MNNTISYDTFYIANLPPKIRRKLKTLLFKSGAMIDILARNSALDVAITATRTSGRIVGWLSASVYYSDWGCHITLNVYVHPQFRRQGIGRHLVGKFHEVQAIMISNAGRKERYICVNKHDKRSRTFWNGLGYKENLCVYPDLFWAKQFKAATLAPH